MTKFLVLLFMLGWGQAIASTTRTIWGDQIITADTTKTYPLPSVQTTLIGQADTATVTNKTISGGSNTLSQVPVQAQIASDTFYGNDSLTAFTLSHTIISSSGVDVKVNGVSMYITTDYTISGTTLTMLTAPAAGQKITVVYSIY